MSVSLMPNLVVASASLLWCSGSETSPTWGEFGLVLCFFFPAPFFFFPNLCEWFSDFIRLLLLSFPPLLLLLLLPRISFVTSFLAKKGSRYAIELLSTSLRSISLKKRCRASASFKLPTKSYKRSSPRQFQRATASQANYSS